MDAHQLPWDIKTYLMTNGMIAPSHAERLLDIGIKEAVEGCNDIWPLFGDFPMAVQEALIDFVYNLGHWGALKFKKAVAAIEARDWNTAADEMLDSKWRKQVGRRADDIVGLIRGAA